MAFLCFALVWIVTVFLSMAEWLRKIQGEAFLVLWPIFAIVVLIIVYSRLEKSNQKKASELCEREIRQATISHVDIPHLMTNNDPIHALKMKGYYLLRLYLLGVVTYKEGALRVDEGRLRLLMDQGGRHSKIAYSILHDVRKTGDRSMSQVLGKIPLYDATDDHELTKKINDETQRILQPEKCIMAAVFGLIWGIGCAKMFLGIMYGKDIAFLAMMFCLGFIGSIGFFFGSVQTLKGRCEREVHAAILGNFRQRPQQRDLSVVSKLNDELPEETERHKILNRYFLDAKEVLEEALKTPEGTFMHDWAETFLSQHEEIKKAQAEAARRAAAASSGCSSCGSCGSCGGCGGCGGCGD